MKSALCFLLLLTCHLCTAQFAKGDKFIGGGYSATVRNSSNGNGEDSNYRSFQIYPQLGYFLNERYAVGGGISYFSALNENDYGQGTYQNYRDRGVGIHAFAKRYFTIAEKFFFSVGGTASYDRSRSKVENGSAESTRKGYVISLNMTPSLIFFPSPNWAIEGGIGGLSLSHSRSLSDDSKSTSFGLNYGSFSLGFSYFFRGPAE
jgi:hypothetical protein